jgi:DNA-binding NarL/FixJ family response regulator
LSGRQTQIIALATLGLKNREMAETLFISVQTVKNHMRRIFEKLGVSDRLTLILWAIQSQLELETAEPSSPLNPDQAAKRIRLNLY